MKPAKRQASRKPVRAAALLAWLDRRSLFITVALAAVATVRIVTTYDVFSHTSDEPAHIACGMEWLDKGVYEWEAQHPPLARVATALGPYLAGVRSQGTSRKQSVAMLREGLAILYDGRHYDRNLALARLGVLPFFWIVCAVVYWWARQDYGGAVASLAVFLFTLLPPVLAHAGLATTDMALTALLGAAFLAGVAWLERPTRRRALVFGAAAGLMVLAKFSSFAFFPVCVAAALACWWRAERPSARILWHGIRRRLPTLALGVAVALVVIWAGYRFSFAHVPQAGMRLPAPELFAGIEQVRDHNTKGHPAFLLGDRSQSGFWCFFEVALAVKTPLPFLILLASSCALAFEKPRRFPRLWLPAAFAFGLLAVGMAANINIGLRHVLPVYIAFAILAAAAAVRWLEAAQRHRWLPLALGALLLWIAGSSVMAHPDYLPYFNELAGGEPEKILVDSDLDWGQDLKRAARRLREVGAREVSYVALYLADLETQHGFPHVIREIDALRPNPGWNLVSITLWKALRLGMGEKYQEYRPWPDFVKPTERVGKGMLLYYFPPVSQAARD